MRRERPPTPLRRANYFFVVKTSTRLPKKSLKWGFHHFPKSAYNLDRTKLSGNDGGQLRDPTQPVVLFFISPIRHKTVSLRGCVSIIQNDY